MRARPAETSRWELAALGLILAVVALSHHHAHWSPDAERYPFPVHLDEHLHWGFAQAAVDEGSVSFGDPFAAEATSDYSLEAHLHERGFHAYLGSFQQATGIPWLALLEYGPATIAILLALAAYVLARPWGAGLEAALGVALIPTSLRFLGPGFLVPIAFALPILCLGLAAAFRRPSAGSVVVVALIAAGLWPIHVVAAAAFLLIVGLHTIVTAQNARWTALATGAAVLLPFLLAQPFYARAFAEDVTLLELPLSLDEILRIGIVPVLLAALGVVALAARGIRAGTTLAIALMGTMVPIFYRAMYGEDIFALYDRSTLLFFVLAVLLAAPGLAILRKAIEAIATRAVRTERVRWGTLAALAVLLAQAAYVGSAIQSREQGQYYHILDEPLVLAFVDAREKLGPAYDRAIVDARASMAFTAITGIPTLSPSYPWSSAPASVLTFFSQGSSDTYLLVETRTSVVVTRQAVTNPDLIPVNSYVYALRPDYVERMNGRD